MSEEPITNITLRTHREREREDMGGMKCNISDSFRDNKCVRAREFRGDRFNGEKKKRTRKKKNVDEKRNDGHIRTFKKKSIHTKKKQQGVYQDVCRKIESTKFTIWTYQEKMSSVECFET